MNRSIALVLAGALALSACVSGHINESQGPQRPDPAEPASGPIVATIEVGETTFELHDEGSGCVAVDIIHPGLQTTVTRGCFSDEHVIASTSTCGWLAPPAAEQGFDCDVRLPEVLFGSVTDPSIGFVCIGAIGEQGGSSGVTGARFIDFIGDGFILDVAGPDEGPAAHLFTAGGSRYGTPPLDAPSDPIYRLCEGQAPWGETALEYGVDLEVVYAESLRTNNVTVLFHSGLDRVGVSGEAFSDDEAVHLPVRVPASSSVLGVTVETEVGPILDWDYPWPSEMLAVLRSGAACDGLTVIQVSVDSEVLDGSDRAVYLTFVGTECDI